MSQTQEIVNLICTAPFPQTPSHTHTIMREKSLVHTCSLYDVKKKSCHKIKISRSETSSKNCYAKNPIKKKQKKKCIQTVCYTTITYIMG